MALKVNSSRSTLTGECGLSLEIKSSTLVIALLCTLAKTLAGVRGGRVGFITVVD